MSTAAVPELDLSPDLARDVLEGLARLHQTVLVFDPLGRVVWHKDHAGLLSGLPRGGATRIRATDLVGPARYAELRSQLRECGQVVNERAQIHLGGGRVASVELSLSRLGEAGSPHHVAALLRPLLDASRRDRERRHTGEYLGAILDAAPEAVLALDAGGFVSYANRAIERLLGFAAEEALDKPISAYVRNPGQLEHVAGLLRTGGEPFVQDLDFRRKDEAIVRVSVSASGLHLPDGKQAGAVLILHDVTEQRRFEAELARKNTELEHYVHTVSHDLRSPLVSLLGFARLLRQDYGGGLDDKALHFLDRIEQAGRTMEALTNDLLELSRIGDRSERKALVDPLRVLAIVQAELKPRLDEQGVTLVLPDCAPLVLCDRTRLYQVFSNLVCNALDHMGAVSDPHVKIQIEERPDVHLISVSDNGRGIDPAQHERIFEIFQSLGPRQNGRRGTGVGLAIVRKIAETHGGRVWVESEPGSGSTFRLQLPRS